MGLPNGPKYFDPISNPEGAVKRQRRVIRDLVKRGYITEQEANEIPLIKVGNAQIKENFSLSGIFI